VQQQEQARKAACPAEEHAEPRWAAGAVGAADRARSGAEQRARTTTDTIVAAAQARRVRSRSASTLDVGQYAARSKPVLGGRLWQAGLI
jgi:hypothetical protein